MSHPQPEQGHCASQTGWRCNPSSRQPGFQGELRPGPECKRKPFWATSRRARVEEGTFVKQSHACFRFFYATQGRGTCEALYVCVSFQSRGHHTLLHSIPRHTCGRAHSPRPRKKPGHGGVVDFGLRSWQLPSEAYRKPWPQLPSYPLLLRAWKLQQTESCRP